METSTLATRLQSRRIVIAVNVLLNSVLSLLLAGALFTTSAQGGALIVAASVPQAVPRHVGAVGIYPDSVVTPAAPNPAVTPDNIKDNICNRYWSTRLVRPPPGYTSRPKRKQLREYGDTVHQTRTELINRITGKVDVTRCVAHSNNMACYEEDHLISGARQKDIVEGYVHDEICHDVPGFKKNSYIPAITSITLEGGQEILAGDWYACY